MQLKKLTEMRKLAGLKKKDMALKLKISPSYYGLLERGQRTMSLEVALRIAAILKTTPNEIFLPEKFTSSKDRRKNKGDDDGETKAAVVGNEGSAGHNKGRTA